MTTPFSSAFATGEEAPPSLQSSPSPEADAASLRALKEELSNSPHGEKSALVHVQRVAPELVDDEHMMIFLRREDYDVRLALKRLLRYWSKRYKIFGPHKYALPMTLQGAMKDDIHTFKRGYLTLLPVQDVAGRSIIYTKYVSPIPKSEEKLRMLWYLVHLTISNPAVQRSGFVILANSRNGRLDGFDPKWASQAATIIATAFPIQWSTVHVCHATKVFPLVASAVRAMLSSAQRRSFLMHNGSDELVLETLAEQGLPRHCVPTDLSGSLHVSAEAFVRDRLAIEGGSFDLTENVTGSLSLSGDDDRGSNLSMDNEEIRDLVNNSSNIEPSNVAGAKPWNDEALIVTSHDPLQSDFQETAPMDKDNLMEVKIEAGLISSGGDEIAPPMLAKQAADGSAQKARQRKRKQKNDPENGSDESKTAAKVDHSRKHGRRGDPRMNRAVEAKVNNPNLSLVAALVAGGFVFCDMDVPGISISDVKDTENVTIYQRRNQLLRRLRYMKGKT